MATIRTGAAVAYQVKGAKASCAFEGSIDFTFRRGELLRDLLGKEIARWKGIPMVENVPLAHALYRAVEVGQAIPAQLYTVVAEILAAIWRAQTRASQTQTPQTQTPQTQTSQTQNAGATPPPRI